MTYGGFRATRAGEWLRFAFLCARFAAAIVVFPCVFWWLFVDGAGVASWWADRTGAWGIVLSPYLLASSVCASVFVAYRVAAWVAVGPRKKARL